MPNRLSIILATLLMVSIFSSAMLSPLGVANEKPQITLRDKVLSDIIRLIPPNASVSTQNELQPHIARRIYCYPYPTKDAEYVLVDTRSMWYRIQFPVWGFQKIETLPTFESAILDLIENEQGGLVASFDGIFLYKKNYSGPVLVNFTPHGLWAEFFGAPRLFTNGQWEVHGGADEEFNVTGSDGSFAKLDSKGENAIQLRTRLQKGMYVLSLGAMATNSVANDLRYGIWDSNDSKWVTSSAATLSDGFKVYELKFNITEQNENNDLYFSAIKEKNIPNEIYIDWVSIESEEPSGRIIVLDMNLDWGTLSPFPGLVTGEKYGVDFAGYLYTPQLGNYTFTLRSDDLSRLYIDNKLVTGGYWGPGILDESTTVYLEKGFHGLKIEYANFVDGGSISLLWNPPWSNNMEFVPNDYFYTEKTQ